MLRFVSVFLVSFPFFSALCVQATSLTYQNMSDDVPGKETIQGIFCVSNEEDNARSELSEESLGSADCARSSDSITSSDIEDLSDSDEESEEFNLLLPLSLVFKQVEKPHEMGFYLISPLLGDSSSETPLEPFGFCSSSEKDSVDEENYRMAIAEMNRRELARWRRQF